MLHRVLAALLPVPFLLAAVAAPAGADADAAFAFQDPRIVESSGLVVVDGLFVTTNDSGDTGRVFTVDPETGETVGVTTWAEEPVDVEALAPAGDGSVWVGDIGDNPGNRPSVTVTKVPVGRGPIDATDAATYELVLPDGPTDAETLLAHPRTGRLLVVTKTVFGGTVLQAPARLSPGRPNELRPVGATSQLGLATDGAFFPGGEHVVLRDYVRIVVYTWPGMDPLAEIPLPEQEQGEGLAVDDRGRVFVSSEGVRQPVLRIPLPGRVREAVSPAEPEPTPTPTPEPQPDASPGADAGSPGEGLGNDLTEVGDADRPAWPWFVGGFVALGALLLLGRSLRPR
ncbi:hypothetical protein [Nocardioides sp. SYSU DS0663]|uniref:hypothetical protein n=1 Tax=Nocardioides sp. SYSU DS0663 TaxID=3416445 RepID=UPI003F4B0DCB